MQYTQEQQEILALADRKDNLQIVSYAGCGKTSTLEALAKEIPGPKLYLAFNKRVADEAEKRMAGASECRTFNSLGHRIWAGTVASKLVLNAKKTRELFKEVVGALTKDQRDAAWEEYGEIRTAVDLAKGLGYVPEGHRVKGLVEGKEFFSSLEDQLSEPAKILVKQILHASILAAYRGNVDFNDQLYMPALFGGSFPRFPTVLVDEAQDLSPVNHEMIRKLAKSSRLISVGDPFQCHPPGTEIYVTGVGYRPIENIHLGTQVGYFSTKEGRFVGMDAQGREIEAINISDFEGNLLKIDVGDKSVKVTPNHRCIARISREAYGYILYAMKRENQFRIGISRIRDWNNKVGSPFGPSLRARQEKADSLWLLEVFDNDIVARAYEQYYSTEFSVPTMLFESEFQQEGVDIFWELIGDNIDKGEALLKAFDRDISYPFWSKDNRSFIGFHRAGAIHAVNLMPKIMTMLVHPPGEWKEIDKIRQEPYIGPVYGITVAERYDASRVYLANGLLVHNSIYQFRGAMQDGMLRQRETFAMGTQQLSVSFRCPRAIVENARWRAPDFRWLTDGGHVEKLRVLGPESIAEDAAIICRNNAPLFALACRLLSAGRSCRVAGSDVGPKLINLLRRLGDEGMARSAVLGAIDAWEQKRSDSSSASDLAACLRIFANLGDDLRSAISYAEHVLKQTGKVLLTTGHKAKGLEWKTVYFLDKWLIGKGEQEKNLDYVISTRARQNLFYIDSRDID